uniref:Tetratricopeptide repeat protein n=1 Tax=Proboscia inermis TaxID=420281 RepID=A0A7S0GBQ0_9STRA|mmetsp:Transcript_17993/g.18216  ORF Transcript_17993/g.18216 Transcript_17993/m.18216 type:complete len:195 (+) Transcript_17993:582-1166(+)
MYAKNLERDKRMHALRMAIESNPEDGEAHMQLGFDLLQGNPSSVEERCEELDIAVDHLGNAARLCPCDARVHHFLAEALQMRWGTQLANPSSQPLITEEDEMARVAAALQETVRCELACVRVGCGSEEDLAVAWLRVATFHARRGRFAKAMETIQEIGSMVGAGQIEEQHPTVSEAGSCYQYCRKQLASLELKA